MQSRQALLGAAHTEGDGGGADVCAWLFQCFLPVWNGTHSSARAPGLGGRWAWQLLWWLPNTMGLVISVEGEDPAIGMLL